MAEYGLENMTGFHNLPDEELDEKVKEFISNHGCTLGQGYVGGYLRSIGLRVQRRRIRESMARLTLTTLHCVGVLPFLAGNIMFLGPILFGT